MKFSRQLAVAVVLIAALTATVATGPAFADARDISVGGVYICKITQPAPGFTAEQRATEINKRITQILSAPGLRQGAVVSVTQNGADALVTVGNMLVFTVTPADAAGSGTTLYVAKRWGALLSEGLSKALPGSTFHF